MCIFVDTKMFKMIVMFFRLLVKFQWKPTISAYRIRQWYCTNAVKLETFGIRRSLNSSQFRLWYLIDSIQAFILFRLFYLWDSSTVVWLICKWMICKLLFIPNHTIILHGDFDLVHCTRWKRHSLFMELLRFPIYPSSTSS